MHFHLPALVVVVTQAWPVRVCLANSGQKTVFRQAVFGCNAEMYALHPCVLFLVVVPANVWVFISFSSINYIFSLSCHLYFHILCTAEYLIVQGIKRLFC